MLGAGQFGAGQGLAGVGVLDVATRQSEVPLPDPTTGLSLTGRLLQQTATPGTYDYAVSADGRVEGMATVEQLVLLAMLRVDVSTLEEKGPNFAKTLRNLVQGALASLVTAGLVQVRTISVSEPSADSGVAVVNWTDLTTNTVHDTPIGSTSP